MRIFLIALSLLLYTAIDADAQVSVGIGSHGVSIGFNISTYPRLVAIPGYPVYYDPHANSNYFFYDGLYWVYADDNWYSSAWYDGPWDLIGPEDVPLFVLRVPVRYYRHRPSYFSGWSLNLAPRWGEHWGHDWEQRRSGWDHWDRHAVPRAAPLPAYQRQYSGSRYPRAAEQQYSIQSRSYSYHPREPITRKILEQRAVPAAGTRDARPQPTPTQQQTRAPDRAAAQQQQRKRAEDQAQAQQRQKAQQQQLPQRTENKAQAQRPPPQKRAAEQAPVQRQLQPSGGNAPAHVQPQKPQQQQQPSSRGNAPAQVQAQPQQQQKPSSRGSEQVQPRQVQHGPAQPPAAKGQSNQREQKKEKDDKKDGGGH